MNSIIGFTGQEYKSYESLTFEQLQQELDAAVFYVDKLVNDEIPYLSRKIERLENELETAQGKIGEWVCGHYRDKM